MTDTELLIKIIHRQEAEIERLEARERKLVSACEEFFGNYTGKYALVDYRELAEWERQNIDSLSAQVCMLREAVSG